MQLEVFNRRQKSKLQRREQAKKSSVAAIIPPTDSACLQDSSRHPTVEQFLTGESPVKESPHIELENDLQPIPDPETPPCVSEDCKRHIKSLEMECQALRTENMLLKDKMNRTGLNEMSLPNSDKKVNILTGIPTYSVLMVVFQFVAPCLKLKSGLTLFQQYMLALIKLRMNFSFEFCHIILALIQPLHQNFSNTVLV